jgi:two-component system, cell cycle sensor histidine kinase and response regulator CckA
LLAFSRKQTLNPRVLNLNEILTEILKMASRLLGEDIEVRTRLSPELLRVKIDQGQFEQVILNLIVNARDAMPAGGQLTIETTNVEWSEDDCRLMPQRKPGSYVVLSVGDTGIGISPQDKPRIFEPFFTTKEPSRGTGLGLSVVYGIVQQSEGYIEVDSVPEQGTTFKLYFPAVREHIANAETPVLAKSASVGTETILLVEDDEGVRNIVKLALEKQGYKLLVAGNGPAALTVMETHPGAIHLLLTDLVLPSMSGRQLAKIMIERYPTIKVVYMTGYTEHVMIKHGLPTDAQHMLLKPFSMIELVRIVQLVLSEPQ